MTSRSSHLVPTSTVDKNGKITTVHKKPMTTIMSSQAMPSVTLSTPTVDDEKITFLGNFDYSSKYRMEEDYRIIQECDPTIIPHINNLANSGSALAHEAMFNYLSYELNDIDDMIDSYEEYEEGIASVFERLPELKMIATMAWNVGSMLDEVGSKSAVRNTSSNAIAQHWKNHPDAYSATLADDTAYWRGLSLYVIATQQTDANINHFEFCEWAGNHPDPSGIHRMMTRHNTSDLDEIKDLMKREADTAPALTQGIL